MNSDLVSVLLLSLVAMANPTLLAAVTAMLILPNPKRLMLRYLLGAYATSITAGLLIVFSLHGSSAENTSKHKISPLEDILIGIVNLAVAFVLATGRDARPQRRRQRRKEAKQASGSTKAPWSERMLTKGSAKLTFVVGALLSFPGLAYLDALDHIVKLNPGTVPQSCSSSTSARYSKSCSSCRCSVTHLRPNGLEPPSQGSRPGSRAADAAPP